MSLKKPQEKNQSIEHYMTYRKNIPVLHGADPPHTTVKQSISWCFNLKPMCLPLSKYSAVPSVVTQFFQKYQQRHPIARPIGPGMGCILLIQRLLHIMPQFLQLLMQYLTTLDHVVTALDCIWKKWNKIPELLSSNNFLIIHKVVCKWF